MSGVLLLAGRSVQAQPCSISLGSDATICAGEDVAFTLPAGYPDQLWSNGSNATTLTVSSPGTYWGQVSYPSGNLFTNGNFSSGNTGFWSDFSYDPDLYPGGNYYIGTNAANFHNQWIGTGNGNFMLVNADWPQAWWTVWCQGVPVCPNQTYTLSFRMANLANQGPATVEWMADWSQFFGQATASSVQGQWNTYTATWTSGPNQNWVNMCMRIISGWGVGNDIGLDDLSMTATINLRDTIEVFVTPLPVVDLGPDVTLCAGDPLVLDATVPGGSYLWQDGSTNATFNVSTAGIYDVTVTANGCSASDAIQVNYNPLPLVDLGPDQTVCAGDVVTLDVTTPGATYLWQDGSTNPTFNVS
ncbi:MAG: hypothetical protein KDB88_14125, partial [Flavobacteriales bacterium]|nr:hypothetical protein [Flavobacteriales bacterium]